jgi:outer membrane protein TolC
LAVPAPDALRPSPPGLPNPLTTQNVPFGPKTNQYAPAEDANSFPTLTTQPPNDLQPLPDVTAAPVDATSADADDPALIPLVEQAYPEPGQPMPRSEATLDKVLAIAATDSTTMREQEQLVAANDASRYRSWVQYLPAVDAKYNVGFFDLIRGDIAGGSQTAFGGAYTVEAYKPIYYWGAIEATKKLALLKEQISQTQAIITYAKLCVDLRRQYYELVSQKSRVQLLALEAESASRRVDKERQLLAAGKSYPAHVDSLEITFRSLQLQQASAANTYEFNVGEFRRLSGALDFDQHDIPDYVVLPHVDIAQMRAQYDGFRKSGFFDTAVNKTATLEQDAIDNQIIINDANSKPTFNLGFGVTQGPYQDNSTRTGGIYFQTIIFGGITGTWHLFDNFQTSDNDRSLRAQRRLVDAELAGSRDRIFSQSANLLDKIEISLRGIAMLKQQLTTLQQDYRQVKQSLALGQSDQTDVDTIRDGILRVKFDILQYQTNVVTAYYSFLTTIFCDPALNNVSIYEHPPSS